MDINASQEIWNFLGRFSLSGIVSADEPVLQKLETFPNPISGVLHISAPHASAIDIRLLDLEGRELKIQPRSSGNGSLDVDLNGFQEGVYLLKVGAAVRRVVVMH